jgi:sulfhydrogenase subunit beta (sulfur reductase)
MDKFYAISSPDWQIVLQALARSYSFYAPVKYNGSMDYELIDEENTGDIIYNHPKPFTPVKTFFLPVKENVTADIKDHKRTLIMGVPSCDLAALDILDEIYLNRDYTDIYYKNRRKKSILIGYDCNSTVENCHCTSYGVNPFPEKNSDILLVKLDEKVFLQSRSTKGNVLLKELENHAKVIEASEHEIKRIGEKRKETARVLIQKNNKLPGYELSGRLIRESHNEIWKSYASTCVSCGACATICPTCTCFLLIDRPDFEKIRQLDACQYPGFERVAAGEDPLGELAVRFKNRYFCKYVWKPVKFKSIACTGCGRCIDTCIGKISKNELLEELASEDKA